MKALWLIPLLLLVGCGANSYTRQVSYMPLKDGTILTNESVRFRNKALFVNSKTTKFALDNLTARGTRNGLNFGSNENEVATEGINAFFQGLNSLMLNAAKLGALGAGVPLPMGGGSSPAPRRVTPTADAAPTTNVIVTIPGL